MDKIAQQQIALDKHLLEKKQQEQTCKKQQEQTCKKQQEQTYTEDHAVVINCNEGKQIPGLTLNIKYTWIRVQI